MKHRCSTDKFYLSVKDVVLIIEYVFHHLLFNTTTISR